MSRSKNPWIVKLVKYYVLILKGAGVIGTMYYGSLLAIWHIPSLSIEFGYNLFYGISFGTLNYLLPPKDFFPIIFNEKNV